MLLEMAKRKRSWLARDREIGLSYSILCSEVSRAYSVVETIYEDKHCVLHIYFAPKQSSALHRIVFEERSPQFKTLSTATGFSVTTGEKRGPLQLKPKRPNGTKSGSKRLSRVGHSTLQRAEVSAKPLPKSDVSDCPK